MSAQKAAINSPARAALSRATIRAVCSPGKASAATRGFAGTSRGLTIANRRPAINSPATIRAVCSPGKASAATRGFAGTSRGLTIANRRPAINSPATIRAVCSPGKASAATRGFAGTSRGLTIANRRPDKRDNEQDGKQHHNGRRRGAVEIKRQPHAAQRTA